MHSDPEHIYELRFHTASISPYSSEPLGRLQANLSLLVGDRLVLLNYTLNVRK